MKNTFYFFLKALFIFKIFYFFCLDFLVMQKIGLDKKVKVCFKIYNVTTWLTNNQSLHFAICEAASKISSKLRSGFDSHKRKLQSAIYLLKKKFVIVSLFKKNHKLKKCDVLPKMNYTPILYTLPYSFRLIQHW